MCTLAWILVAVLALSSPSAGAACACGNGGTSIAEPDSNECMCHCAAGFTGDTCAQTISESCSSNPCMNNAPCSGLGIGDFTGGTNSTNFAKHTVGLRFKTTESIVVTHLGSHDFLGSGLLTDRTVGLWDSGGNLLASTVLEAGAGAPLRGGYRLKKLANSITLKANKEFSIGQRSATTYQYKWQLERLITHPSVLWVGARVSTQTTFANPTDDSYNYFGRLTATFVVAGDTYGTYVCDCPSGYTGSQCDVNINPCGSSPCENGASCIDDVNGYTCSCAAGYSGDKCQNDIDECASVPCQNSATCVDGVDGFTCSCTAGYDGTLCNNNIDECASAPCQNGASCTDGVDGYTCTCALGYNGVECQTNINECASNPCENGATCTDAVNGFTCACVSGYDGTMCDNDINECASSPCENGASCIDDVNGYTCSCAAGYSGDKCQNDIDECASVPCQNSATCVDGVDGFTCTCAGGFDGTLCDNDIDECASAPCQNGASCIDGVNGFLCACVSGYTSTLCESDIDECASSPCGEALACVNGVDGYTCVTIESILSTSNAQIASASQPAVESASESLATVMAVPAAASNSSIVNSVLESIDATAATAFAGTSSTVQNNMFNTVEEAMDAPAAGAAHTVATAKNVTAPGRVVERVARSILDATQSCATVTSATQSSQGGKFNATTRRGPSASLSDATLSASGSSIRVPSSLATYLGTLSACTQVHIAKIAKASLLSSDAAGTATTGMLVSSVTSVGFADESVSFAGAADPLEITVELSGSLTAAEVSRVRCVYWDFASVSWSGEGCTVQSRSAVAVTCACSHTTNFAVLLDPSTTVSRSTAAMVTSYIAVFATLVGSLAVIIVFITLPKTFRTAPTRVLMFICSVQVLQQVVFVVDLAAATSFGDAACFVTGLLLHYFTLVLFLLLACYGYLVFSMLVKMDAHLRKLARRLTLFAALTPILVVAIYTAVVSIVSDVNGLTAYTKSASGFCYLSSSTGVYAAVIAPLALIMAWNLTIVCLMVYRLLSHRRSHIQKSISGNQQSHTSAKLFISLSCALGLSWIFGLLTSVWNSPAADYMFCAASIAQAVVLVIGYCTTERVRSALSSRLTRSSATPATKSSKSKSKDAKNDIIREKAIRTKNKPKRSAKNSLDDEYFLPESGITMLDMCEQMDQVIIDERLDSPMSSPMSHPRRPSRSLLRKHTVGSTSASPDSFYRLVTPGSPGSHSSMVSRRTVVSESNITRSFDSIGGFDYADANCWIDEVEPEAIAFDQSDFRYDSMHL